MHVSVCILLIVTDLNNVEIHRGVNFTFHGKPLNILVEIPSPRGLAPHSHTRVHVHLCMGPIRTARFPVQLEFTLVNAIYLGIPPLICFFSKHNQPRHHVGHILP